VALLPPWAALYSPLQDPSTRYRLLPFARFCSGIGIEPAGVDEAVVDRFMEHRALTTTRASDAATRRILARLWNAQIDKVEEWPQVRLMEPPVKATLGPTWEDFPEGLRQDVEAYLAGLGKVVRRNKANQRIKGCKASTITTRRREIVAAVRMAVRERIPLESLTSLKALVHPDVVEKIIEAYWRKDGELPKTYTINLASRFVGLAHLTGGFDEDAVRRLEDMRFTLEGHRDDGLTEKNASLIRLVLTDGVWSRIVSLPGQLMQQARLLRSHAPVKAALLAQIAVAVAILTVAPIRLANLASIRLDENLTKPGGPDSNFWLVFPKYDVKNRVRLQFKLDDFVTGVINEYVHDFRPARMHGRNDDWLFPGETCGHKEKISFSTQIVERIHKATGLRVTVHQFRHAAGALSLKHQPGNYQLVSQTLGHKRSATALKFYLDLNTTQASEIFTDMVRNKLNFSGG
jgi:integrase